MRVRAGRRDVGSVLAGVARNFRALLQRRRPVLLREGRNVLHPKHGVHVQRAVDARRRDAGDVVSQADERPLLQEEYGRLARRMSLQRKHVRDGRNGSHGLLRRRRQPRVRGRDEFGPYVPMSVRVLLDSELLRVEHDPEKRLLVLRRTAVRIPDSDGDPLEPMRLALLGIDRAHTALLVDMRAPPIRNDDTMDRIVTGFQEIIRGFRRTAILVRTATGKLQISRTAREGNTAAVAFTDESKALAFLLA